MKLIDLQFVLVFLFLLIASVFSRSLQLMDGNGNAYLLEEVYENVDSQPSHVNSEFRSVWAITVIFCKL